MCAQRVAAGTGIVANIRTIACAHQDAQQESVSHGHGLGCGPRRSCRLLRAWTWALELGWAYAWLEMWCTRINLLARNSDYNQTSTFLYVAMLVDSWNLQENWQWELIWACGNNFGAKNLAYHFFGVQIKVQRCRFRQFLWFVRSSGLVHKLAICFLVQCLLLKHLSEDCFYYCSERNNVVVLFGTLKVQSFILTEVSDCGLLIVVTSSTFLKRKDMLKEKSC